MLYVVSDSGFTPLMFQQLVSREKCENDKCMSTSRLQLRAKNREFEGTVAGISAESFQKLHNGPKEISHEG